MASGEAMIMGSPMSSPNSPGAHGTMQPPNPYLPSYLMGDPAPLTSPVQSGSRLFSGTGGSPNKGTSFSKASTFASPFSPHTGQMQQRSEPRRPKEKPGAPPVSGLLETITSPTGTPDHWGDSSRLGNTFSNTSQLGTPGGWATSMPQDQSQVYTPGRKTPPSPAQIDPFYTQGESIRPQDELDETWVTIFGFPPAATSFILQQFSQYGNIIKHVVATDGNWMHVHYQSKLQAKKALSKNGKVFGGTIMVGVTPCIDKNVTQSSDQSMHAGSRIGTPSRMNQSILDQSLNTSRNTSMRPLTAAYKAANSEHEVLHKNNTPQKNNGLISKTMEYVFGW